MLRISEAKKLGGALPFDSARQSMKSAFLLAVLMVATAWVTVEWIRASAQISIQRNQQEFVLEMMLKGARPAQPKMEKF
jgi:hypothetical protein